MSEQRAGGQTDWKEKYLSALDDQEKRERAQHQLVSLLMQAVVRISLLADGIDETLDKQLAGLRKMLRDGNPSKRDLDTVVDALDGQGKRLDTVKSERAKVVIKAFESLIEQLQTLRPSADARQKLRRLDKGLKGRAARVQEYSALINEYATLQRSVLQDGGGLRVSKPFWHRWAPEESPAAEAGEESVADKEAGADTIEVGSDKPLHIRDREDRGEAHLAPPPALAGEGLDLSDDMSIPPETVDPSTVGEEPPFSRLNTAVCGILGKLLEQIEPPPMARDNYLSARKQLNRGLNWYELVPVLEDISIVVISAFDNHQQDFEKFLSRLNERLSETYEFILASKTVHQEGAESSRQLRDSMQAQVSAMQQSVASAVELDQLKREVSQRLDQIVAAMDRHASGEELRESSLTEQLDALVKRVKSMEAASVDMEQRIEEQRQKALLDVLTQLPNREAYQLRLEQEFDRWQRYRRPLTMVVCDVDHFKRINDNYGHLAGDKVLRIIAKTLKTRLRKTDFIARYGGEEFVVLMPETREEVALKVAEGVREAIANCPFHFKEQPVKITTSFGISEFGEGDKAEAVFARADKALYGAKAQGRNCCILAPPADAGPPQ